VNTPRISLLPISHTDLDIYWDKIVMGGGITPAGGSITIQVIGRWTDASNFYACELLYTTSNTVELRLRKLVAGSFTLIATSGTISGVTPGGTAFAVRFQMEGTTLRGRAWNRSTAEPDTWNVTSTDASFSSGTRIGMRTNLETGNSNTLPVTFAFDNLFATPFDLPGLYLDEFQLEMNDTCTDWEYGQGQPLVSIRTDSEVVPRIRRTTLSISMTEVTP